MTDLVAQLAQARIVPVVVLPPHAIELAEPLARAVLAGGCGVIEVTFRTAGAAEAIARMRERVPEVLVGAGTLTSPALVDAALAAGAAFGVAPGLNPTVVTHAKRVGLPFIPGVMTPSEVEQALELGCQTLKFFPAVPAGGVAMLKSFAAAYGHLGLKIMPTGGISEKNLAEFAALPVVAAIGASWVVETALIAEGNWAEITARTAAAVEIARRR